MCTVHEDSFDPRYDDNNINDPCVNALKCKGKYCFFCNRTFDNFITDVLMADEEMGLYRYPKHVVKLAVYITMLVFGLPIVSFAFMLYLWGGK